jgi:peptidoglycan/LPS O-acetylase OafA/YrhL
VLRIRPFVMGHLVAALLVGAGTGALLSPDAMLIGGIALLAGAVVSSLVCQWKPGVEAPAWQLWAVAVLANPVFVAALAFMAFDWKCVLGLQRGLGCLGAAMAIIATALCFLPPLGGLLWRAWKRSRARPR